MIGRCIRDNGAALGGLGRGAFYTSETVFHVDVGSEYRIMGIGIFDAAMVVLVCDETGKPNWLPIGLFELESTKLPGRWEFRVLDGVGASGGDVASRWVMKWGYPALVRDASHSDHLVERDPRALEEFYAELARAATDSDQEGPRL
jgi:hypothetical protein